jgi:hypothetical protein
MPISPPIGGPRPIGEAARNSSLLTVTVARKLRCFPAASTAEVSATCAAHDCAVGQEIAREALALIAEVQEIAADGVITPAERAHICRRLTEMHHEVTTGEILP